MSLEPVFDGFGEGEAPDPGFWVSKEELLDYVSTVDNLIRDMNRYIVNNESKLTPSAISIMPAWVKFRIQWEERRDDIRDSFLHSGDDYDDVREDHKKALEFKKQFEGAGLTFSKVEVVPVEVSPGVTGEKPKEPSPLDAPKPSSQSSPSGGTDERSPTSTLLGAGKAILLTAGGATLLLGGYMAGKAVAVFAGFGRR